MDGDGKKLLRFRKKWIAVLVIKRDKEDGGCATVMVMAAMLVTSLWQVFCSMNRSELIFPFSFFSIFSLIAEGWKMKSDGQVYQ